MTYQNIGVIDLGQAYKREVTLHNLTWETQSMMKK